MKNKTCVLKNKRSTFIDKSVKIGNNVVIYENCRIEGESIIEDNVTIFPNCYIKNSVIKNDCVIESSKIENAVIGEACSIGPYARIRPNTLLRNKVKIGNFVEVKNSIIDDGCKINHLAYVGDVEIGKNCNIGCGVIFANYNGKIKQKSKVGNDCFIGSNSNIIAPVIIEDKSFICAGTTVVDNVKSESFVIGRVRQEVKENRARKYLNVKGE